MEGLGILGGRDTKMAVQQLPAAFVVLQGPGVLIETVVTAHQMAVERFYQIVDLQPRSKQATAYRSLPCAM